MSKLTQHTFRRNRFKYKTQNLFLVHKISNDDEVYLRRGITIERVISEYIPLTKLKCGDHLGSYCVFCDTKSNKVFRISKKKKVFKCFNCGASGDFISFIMEYNKIPFTHAVFMLWYRYIKDKEISLITRSRYRAEESDDFPF